MTAAEKRDPTADANRTTIRNRLVLAVKGLALTVLASYLCAGAFVVTTFWSLPASDAAYRRPLALLDPFVWTVAISAATAIAIVVFPVALFSLWHRDVQRSGLFVLGVTVLTILVATPFLSVLAIPIAVLVAVAALLVCRFVDVPLLRWRPKGIM